MTKCDLYILCTQTKVILLLCGINSVNGFWLVSSIQEYKDLIAYIFANIFLILDDS